MTVDRSVSCITVSYDAYTLILVCTDVSPTPRTCTLFLVSTRVDIGGILYVPFHFPTRLPRSFDTTFQVRCLL